MLLGAPSPFTSLLTSPSISSSLSLSESSEPISYLIGLVAAARGFRVDGFTVSGISEIESSSSTKPGGFALAVAVFAFLKIGASPASDPLTCEDAPSREKGWLVRDALAVCFTSGFPGADLAGFSKLREESGFGCARLAGPGFFEGAAKSESSESPPVLYFFEAGALPPSLSLVEALRPFLAMFFARFSSSSSWKRHSAIKSSRSFIQRSLGLSLR